MAITKHEATLAASVECFLPGNDCMPYPTPTTDVSGLINELRARQQSLDERRAEPRYALNHLISLGAYTDAAGFQPEDPAWGIDLSRQGMGVLLDRPVAPGDRLHASVRAEGVQPVIVPIEVVFCRRIWSVVFRVGCVIPSDG